MALRALVVDDHPGTRSTIARVLRRAGWEVAGQAADGESALALAGAAADLDVVVLDIHLPGLDGLEVARRLAASGHRAAVVLVSSEHHDDGQQLSRGTSARGFISKDEFSAARVAELIEKGP